MARRSAQMVAARFVAPPSADGHDQFETENVRLRLAPLEPRAGQAGDALLAEVRIENKRPSLAHINARRSCLIDPELGAINLYLADQILPPESFVLLSAHSRSFIAVNITWTFVTSAAPPPEPRLGRQRVLLSVEWEDGTKEELDAAFEVREWEADESAPPAAS